MTTKIIVGIDGSAGSDTALAWALHEAAATHAEVELVHGWLAAAATVDLTGTAMGACEVAGAELLAEAEAMATRMAPEVKVTTTLAASRPVDAIVEAARHGDLVVVGSRGRGGMAGLLLGSVSQQVLHNAPCPVTVVPTGFHAAA